MSMKNPLTLAGIEPATFRIVATVFCRISKLIEYYRDSPFSRKAAIWTGRQAKTYSPQIRLKISIKSV